MPAAVTRRLAPALSAALIVSVAAVTLRAQPPAPDARPPAPDLRIAFGWRLSLPLPLSLRRLAGISPPSASPQLLIARPRRATRERSHVPSSHLAPPTIALVPMERAQASAKYTASIRCGARRSTLRLANHRNKVFRSVPANL